jgi:hypothetical protein
LARGGAVRAQRRLIQVSAGQDPVGDGHRPGDRVTLEDLAAPFAQHLCGHLRLVNKQVTSPSSKILDACRAFNQGDLPEDKLIEATARLGFNNVIDAFHVVGAGPIPVRFFEDERKSDRGAGAIRSRMS